MKAHGQIPRWFRAAPQLQIGDRDVASLIREAGTTPLFVYDLNIVGDRVATLRAALPPQVRIHYAVKANPHPQVVAAIAPLVDGLDIASGGELARVRASSLKIPVSFAGPGKRDDEIEAAIVAGVTINLESDGEARRALAIAQRLGIRPRLAVRVNPDFSLKGSGMKMGGGPAAFGVDAERAGALVRHIVDQGADWRGFHIFAGSQTLDTEAIIASQAATVALAARLAKEAGSQPPLVNLGGGFGIPYFAGDASVDVERVGAALGEVLAAVPASLAGSCFALELGRWLVGECGVYLTRVIDRKESRGETFLVTDGGLHHQLAASGNFGTVVRRNYPIAVATQFDAPAAEIVNVVGCLCTPLDRLGDAVHLPVVKVGDVIAIFLAGAYGASASPSAFLGHGPASELILSAAGPQHD